MTFARISGEFMELSGDGRKDPEFVRTSSEFRGQDGSVKFITKTVRICTRGLWVHVQRRESKEVVDVSIEVFGPMFCVILVLMTCCLRSVGKQPQSRLEGRNSRISPVVFLRFV